MAIGDIARDVLDFSSLEKEFKTGKVNFVSQCLRFQAGTGWFLCSKRVRQSIRVAGVCGRARLLTQVRRSLG